MGPQGKQCMWHLGVSGCLFCDTGVSVGAHPSGIWAPLGTLRARPASDICRPRMPAAPPHAHTPAQGHMWCHIWGFICPMPHWEVAAADTQFWLMVWKGEAAEGAVRHPSTLAHHCPGTLAFQHPGTPAIQHLSSLAHWHPGIPAPEHHGTPAPQNPGTPEPWHPSASQSPGTMASWYSSAPALRYTAPLHSGILAPQSPGTPAPWHPSPLAPQHHGILVP